MSQVARDCRLELLVLQGTPFCNLDCDYCYLPNRASTKRISPHVLRRIFEQILPHPIARRGFTIVWHAGEPMAMPVRFYEEAISLVEAVNPNTVPIAHSFQTNGTLITPAWCDFIKRHQVRIGVSVDGPAFLHDEHRKTRRGQPTHSRVMAGIQCLRDCGIDFHVISVLTSKALNHPDELFDFYIANRIARVGFNVEEIEGVNHRSSLNALLAARRVRGFFRRFAELVSRSGGALAVRELDGLRQFVLAGEGYLQRNQENTPLTIISIDCEGQVSTFSPELLGAKSDRYQDFVIGNIVTDDLDDILASARLKRLTDDIDVGVERCRETCAYFGVCGGGSPSNKYFENGGFDSTDTMHCRLQKQAVIDVVLDIEERVATGTRHH